MKNRGVGAARLTREPEERRFAEAWERYNETGSTLDYLLDPVGSGRPVAPTDREREVAATVVQWLGSHVGQCFLRELGCGEDDARELSWWREAFACRFAPGSLPSPRDAPFHGHRFVVCSVRPDGTLSVYDRARPSREWRRFRPEP